MAPSTLSLLMLSVLIFLQKANSNKITCHNPCLRNKLKLSRLQSLMQRSPEPDYPQPPKHRQLHCPKHQLPKPNSNCNGPTKLPSEEIHELFIDLSGSPFIPEHYNNSFTFLNCSSNSTTTVSGLRRIDCLSNENFTVVAMLTTNYESLPYMPPPSCKELKKRVFLPVRWSESETKLKWKGSYCRRCEDDGGTCGFKGDTGLAIECKGRRSDGPLPRSAKYGIVLGAGIPGCYASLGLEYSGGNQPTTALSTAIAPQPSVVITGLDAPTIESYPKTQLGDSGRLPKPNDNTCPICLSEYQPKDTLRTIPDCSHYFHANCIDEWLKMNATCPLCRNSPDGSSLMNTFLSLVLSIILSVDKEANHC
ncbi:RING-H2 finger protein ATL20-like [Populus alba x Populus x berolinensis]|uniref:RING-type E3 ubiquitin transferase n=1 Tax=Populus alba x Populus x berolinensis TaxID=444605 RepID=A0AAD6RAX2_9ROSI|nr:RING-H2 finger protein ATL20-like [Populus alba x Populus x berolinensis]